MKVSLPPQSPLTPIAVIGVTLALLFHRAMSLVIAALFMTENERQGSLFILMTLVIMVATDWACIRWRRNLRANGWKFLAECLLLPLWIDVAVMTVYLGAKALTFLALL